MSATGGLGRCNVLIASIVTWVMVVLWMALPMGGLSVSGKQLFNWHPILMTLAVIVLIPQGILMWRGLHAARVKGEDLESARRMFKICHAVMQMAGFAVANAGVAVAYTVHAQRGEGHCYSLHSWLGLLTLLVMKCNVVGGLVRWGVKKWVGGRVRTGHGQVGKLAATVGILTAVTGVVELQVGAWRDGQKFGKEGITAGMVGALIVLVGGGVGATVWGWGKELQSPAAEGQEVSRRGKVEAGGPEL